jgi:CubicO group peptidase (beta-lactamase class C family)
MEGPVNVKRRQVIRYAAGAVAAGLAGPLFSSAARAEPATTSTIPTVPPVTPDDIVFEPRRLRPGRPAEVGLLPEPVAQIRVDLEAYLRPTSDHLNYPSYAGAAVLAAKDGVVVLRAAAGKAVRYASPTVELPADQQIAATTDTIFDLASVTKLFTAVTLMQLVEKGLVDLDAPVASYVPEFGKPTVTVRHLLTHTSGLPGMVDLYIEFPTPETRLAGALAMPVTPGTSPGAQYVYADLGFIALGVLIERKTGLRLDKAVHTAIIEPLSMKDTSYRPGPELRPRIAATEFQDYVGRGMVWGEVHDEDAWSLGGIAGHAGLFSTVDDMAVFCQMLLNGGQYRGRRILREKTIRQMLVNYNAHLEALYPDSDRGLGFELAKTWYMGGMASPVTFGHTGFTGTSLVIDPLSHTFLILLANRVHPTRAWGTNTAARRALATDLADATPVRPLFGGMAWRAGRRNGATVTLTAALTQPATGRASHFIWYDTETRYDTVYFETSPDGGANWTPVASFSGYGGRRWLPVSTDLAAGTTHLRWRYVVDGASQGRGVYVDHVAVSGHPLADSAFTADGWYLSQT